MASSELQLNEPDATEAWLRCLAATARTKKLKDTDGDFQVTDLFLAKAGVSAIQKVSTIVYPREIEEMKFEEIRKAVLEAVRPKKPLVIAERVKFLSLRQESQEGVASYVQRLKNGARFCEFGEIGKKGQSEEDDLIQMRLIDGLENADHRTKALEHLQTENPKLSSCVNFIQQLEMISKFNRSTSIQTHENEHSPSVMNVDKNQIRQKCKYCGFKHESGKCPAYGKTCNACKQKNHFQSVCRSKSKRVQKIDQESSDESNVYAVTSKKSANVTEIKIDNIPFQMQLDTGSQVTIIPVNFWKKLGSPRVRKCNAKLRQFDGSEIKTIGQMDVLIETESQFFNAEVVIADCIKQHGLIGTDVITVSNEKLIQSVESNNNGRLIGYEANIVLKENVKPCYFESRSLPIFYREPVIAKLQQLIKDGKLEKVPPGGSKWASPLVVVRKPDGDFRICGDYCVGVNSRICSDSYPVPKIEESFHKLSGMKFFGKIDLKGAYNQIPMNNDAREITTVNTPIGLLRWTVVPYGIKTASAMFQRAMENTIDNCVDNCVIFQDDIAVGGETEEDLEAKMNLILEKLEKSGMVINHQKTVFKSPEINFLGYKISSKGIEPNSKLVSKVLETKVPQNRKQLDSFVGLVNYYGRHIDKFAELLQPLNDLRKKGVKFVWGEKQQNSFENLKKKLASKPVIGIFDTMKEVTLTTDASEKAVSGILSQEGHPVFYMSHKLSESESRYSNIEREALAIVWCTNRARSFLLGRKFKLISDHLPLQFLLNPNRSLPKVTSARIQRWALHMTAFDYEIEYVKGEKIPHADALNRLDFCDSQIDKNDEVSFVHWIDTDVLKMDEIQNETQQDKLLMSIISRIKRNNCSNCSIAERCFKQKRNALSVDKSMLCFGEQIVVPSLLRQRIIQAVHNDTHAGINTTRNKLCSQCC